MFSGTSSHTKQGAATLNILLLQIWILAIKNQHSLIWHCVNNSMAAGLGPCLAGSLINAKSFLICSAFFHRQWRILFLGAKSVCGRMLMGICAFCQSLHVVAFCHHLQNHSLGLWPCVCVVGVGVWGGGITVTLSTLIFSRLTSPTAEDPLKWCVNVGALKCDLADLDCWNGQISSSVDRNAAPGPPAPSSFSLIK